MNLKELGKEMPYRWRVQSFSKNKPQASCVAYIDARDAMKLLDEVCGPENWQDDYREIGGMLFGGLAIRVNKEWIWKWDTGSESNIEKEKGHVSDSFKRAGVKWGIGRFLYDLEIQYVNASEKKTGNNYPYVVDDNGKRVWDLTKHINSRNGNGKQSRQTPKTPPQGAQTGRTASVVKGNAVYSPQFAESARFKFVNYAKQVFSDQLPAPMPEALEKFLLKADKTIDDQRALLKWFSHYICEGNKEEISKKLLEWSTGRGHEGFNLFELDEVDGKEIAFAYKKSKVDFKKWVEGLDGKAEPPSLEEIAAGAETPKKPD